MLLTKNSGFSKQVLGSTIVLINGLNWQKRSGFVYGEKYWWKEIKIGTKFLLKNHLFDVNHLGSCDVIRLKDHSLRRAACLRSRCLIMFTLVHGLTTVPLAETFACLSSFSL